MKHPVLRAVAAVAAAFLLSGIAHAQLFRAYVSSAGSDSNPCTLQQPCRLLPAAVATLASGGEIWILDSANFNTSTVVVDRDVTIMAVPGQVGSIVAIGGTPALSLASGVKLKLRNVNVLSFASSPGTDGIATTGANTVIVEDSLFSVPGTAIDLKTGGAFVDNTTFRNCSMGVLVHENASAEIARSKFTQTSGHAVIANATSAGTASASVSDSVFAGNSYGVVAWSTVASANSRVSVTRSTFTLGFGGVLANNEAAGGSAVVTIGSSSLTQNNTAFAKGGADPAGAVIETQGNNQVRMNVTDVSGGSLSSAPSM